MEKKGVLLINLGTPDSPSVEDVRKYLNEFLMDERVIDAPFIIRYAIVKFFILPKRPESSAEAYRKIWTSEGSPLLVYSKKILEKVKSRVSIPVELAMRYGNPSVESAIKTLASQGIEQLFLIPLFPQYAMSTFESAVKHVEKTIRKTGSGFRLLVKEPFYNDSLYINSLAGRIREFIGDSRDHLIFSYHGLPERHIRKTDPTGRHCLKTPDCCKIESPAHRFCYRHQCFQTTRLVASKLGLNENEYTIAFQSRLGVDKWLEPSTTSILESLPKRGIKRVKVVCPSFITDCIETLEEIGIRARETFLNAGGENLDLIPCLNDYPLWIDAITSWINDFVENH